MGNLRATRVFVTVLSILGLCSCGGGSSAGSGGPGNQGTASVFTIGTDAPLPSVVSCQVEITGVTINNGTTDISVLTNPQVVDFAQLSGLHQLIDLNAVPTGNYVSATVTLANPVISFIDTTQNPPTITTLNGTLSNSMVKVTFPNAFMMSDNDLVGLRMEFDIRKSLATDGNGQITGTVNPVMNMQLLAATDSDVTIDDFLAGVVGVTGDSSFVVQGPKGRQWTVQTSANTVFDDPNDPLSSFTTNTIVAVSGTLDPVSKEIDATEVEVVSNDGFYLAGLFTSIRPSPGPATAADLFVRAELPDVNSIEDGQITTLALNGSEQYRIANISNPITTLLFNNSALAPGQSVAVGGKITTTNGSSSLTVHRVVLRRQGQAGTLVPGQTVIQNGNQGSFELTDNWTAGVLLPEPLTVVTTNTTNFVGLNGLSDLTGQTAIPLRVVGFVLIDPLSGSPVLVARSVEEPTSGD